MDVFYVWGKKTTLPGNGGDGGRGGFGGFGGKFFTFGVERNPEFRIFNHTGEHENELTIFIRCVF